MRVTFDDQIFSFQRRGGVARYFAELVDEYRTLPELGIEVDTPFRFAETEYVLGEGSPYRRLPGPLRRPQLARVLNRAAQGPRLRTADVLHHTHYTLRYLRLPARARVCTVYDMIPEEMPELFADWTRVPHNGKREYVAACDAVTCISAATRDDVLKHYGHLDKPVVVTPLGVDDRFVGARPPIGAKRGFLLHVGSRQTYKNFDVLARAVARLAEAGTDVRLVCAGPPFDEAELARLAELGIDRRVERRDVDDTQLPGLYASAAAMVFPSRYEGFGLPIVEAFAASCPAVLADMACSREVGGEAAQFFAPDDDEALAAILERLLADEGERRRWIDAGLVRARDFTWRRCAELTAELYHQLGAGR